jgi:hypothetical protein
MRHEVKFSICLFLVFPYLLGLTNDNLEAETFQARIESSVTGVVDSNMDSNKLGGAPYHVRKEDAIHLFEVLQV